jgi:hypothetical protein
MTYEQCAKKHNIESCSHADSKKIQTCIAYSIIDHTIWFLKCRIKKKEQRKIKTNKKRMNSRFLVNSSKISSFNFEKIIKNLINLILRETWSRISSFRKRRMRKIEIEFEQSFSSTRFSRQFSSLISKTSRSRNRTNFEMRFFFSRQLIEVKISISISISALAKERTSFWVDLKIMNLENMIRVLSRNRIKRLTIETLTRKKIEDCSIIDVDSHRDSFITVNANTIFHE